MVKTGKMIAMNYSEKAENLFECQLSEWKLADENYRQLSNVKTRSIVYDGFEILIQFNPGRITSSAAKVDARSVQARPCFLCEKNRPEQQRGLHFDPGMTVLVNPFPIFRKHLTIAADAHTDQQIAGNFVTMLKLSEALPEYQVFYNGPRCGASAPDHFHFQAGNKGFLPIEKDFNNQNLCKLVSEKNGVGLWRWSGYQRGVLTLTGKNLPAIADTFEKFYNRFALEQSDKKEPMLNILSSFDSGEWTVHIFPRKLHRPSQYFAEGNGRILLSPASVDMGGVLITPRGEDFLKLTKADLDDIFNQVSPSDIEMLSLITDLT